MRHLRSLSLGLFCVSSFGMISGSLTLAQEADKKPEEVFKVASVEVTPAQGTSTVGGKLQFKAVAKDASGQALPDLVKNWFVAPFDSGAAEDNGEVSFVQPGEITVSALIGKKLGYAHILVSKPHIARIDVSAPSA